ncbi:MAG: CDP-diacylglycerol--serine O-phosphatidyltransferase [Woeseia sp.]|nr:CDP-alcohol phosphatidyltransferase family protein [Woeseia sp.]MBT8097201.1 CDP-alcohol phosphatidyltransferase family protein [Woeseia sp.]NNE60868.1 CDP-diacylglycerol--serine O-phosphatidyltransferase [Woeseia sp.]NNL55698.1 CDP-diacylglycerol--serine O-phosphatidyltransferase [Woeseia sp.]
MSILRYTIPNSFTAASLLLGLGSIVASQLGHLELAGWMIVWCGLLDVLDGLAARLLKATSTFGAEFDSMADLVSFGVAPGMLVFHAGMQIGGVEIGTDAFLVLLLSVGSFVLAGALRLARFNLAAQNPGDGWFAGIPITACGGGLISTAVILLVRHEGVADALPLHAYLPVLMFVLALGMISTIRFPKIRRRDSVFLNAFQGFNFVASYYCGITRSYPELLFGMAVFILITGIVAGRIHGRQLGAA